MKTFGKLILLLALVIGGYAVWRGFFYYPNDEVESVGIPATADVAAGGLASSSSKAPIADGPLPSRLLIPKLEIDAQVQHLGITKKGNMAAPNNFTDVSWYKLGTVPGKVGSAVMSGHEDNAAGLDGVFKHLEDLQVGDDVYVVDNNGTRLHFKVTEKKIYPYNLSGPELEKVFSAHDKARLNLITCTGHWVQSIKTNDKRLVVFTELVK